VVIYFSVVVLLRDRAVLQTIRISRYPEPQVNLAAATAYSARTVPRVCARGRGGRTPALLEVYPHPALLRLLGARYRLPYKVGNRRKYWPDAAPDERLARVLQQLDEIRCALQREIDGVPLDVPPLADIASETSLKAIEDTLDALICGWVGIRYLAGRCRAYGDDTAAIWIPTADGE
jgi:predicted RNase H-like nuclease